jgi:hypothetical protein
MAVKGDVFPHPPYPNWTAIGVNWLAGFHFEIKVIARIPDRGIIERKERQMSDENKTILTRANAEVVKGNNEGLLAYCTDDVVWEFVGEQTLKGKEAVRRYMSETYVEPPQVTIDRLIAEGEFVTAIGEITLRGASATGSWLS